MTDSAARPPAGEEIALLKAAQSGDQRAFGQLVEPYRRALTVHSYRMLGSPHDAEDIVQETLLRAWRNLGSYEPRAPLSSWLYRIATNASLDEIERRPRRPQPVEPSPTRRSPGRMPRRMTRPLATRSERDWSSGS